MNLYIIIETFVLICIAVLKVLAKTATEAGVCIDSNAQLQAQAALKNSIKSSYKVDVVFVLDRSASTKDTFNVSKELLRDIIRKYYLVHPDFARVFIITFAKSVHVDFHPLYNRIVSCITDDIVTNIRRLTSNDESSSNIHKVLDHVAKILQGKDSRDNVRKMIWLFSDGEVKSDETSESYMKPSELKQSMDIFVVGQRLENRGWMEKEDENFLKEIGTVYSCLSQWQDIVSNVPSIMPDATTLGNQVYYAIAEEEEEEEETEPEAREPEREDDENNNTNKTNTTNPTPLLPLRRSQCEQECLQNSACYCNAVLARTQCTCKPGYYLIEKKCEECPSETEKPYPGPSECVKISKKSTNTSTVNILGWRIEILYFGLLVAGISIVFLLIIIVPVCICCWRKRRKQEKENGNIELNENRRVPPPPMAPPPPSADPPDYEDAIYGEVDLNNQALYIQPLENNLPEWDKYLIEGIQKHCISGMYIISKDQHQWARTPGFKLKQDEVKNLFRVIQKLEEARPGDSLYTNVYVKVQGKKYSYTNVADRPGMLRGEGPIGGRSQNVLWAQMTKDFLVVAKAPKDKDQGQCRAEVISVFNHLENIYPR